MDTEMALMVAVIAVGLTQFSKNFIPEKVPTWVYSIVMFVLALGAAAAAQFMPDFITNWLLGVSVAQTGYETVLQSISKVVKKIGAVKPAETTEE